MNQLKSSVILCTRNRSDDLVRCLNSFLQQTDIPQEIVIVDSSDTPIDTNENVQKVLQHPSCIIKYCHTKPGLTRQRNIGITMATGDVLYFFDDDVVASPEYLTHMNIIFAQHPEWGGGMGTVTNIPHKRTAFLRKFFLLQRIHASGEFTYSGMPTHSYGTIALKKVEVLGGCCMAYRSWVFKKYLFDESLGGYCYMEDCDFSRRVSYDYPLFFNPKAQLQHIRTIAGRDDVVTNRAMYIKNYSYLFFKNFYPHNKLKVIAYCWTVLGLFVQALLGRDRLALTGYIKGLRQYYTEYSQDG